MVGTEDATKLSASRKPEMMHTSEHSKKEDEENNHLNQVFPENTWRVLVKIVYVWLCACTD